MKTTGPKSIRSASEVEGVVRSSKRHYLSARVAIALVALATLVVPGIAAVVAAAAAAF
jgi:hypothetical protein